MGLEIRIKKVNDCETLQASITLVTVLKPCTAARKDAPQI